MSRHGGRRLILAAWPTLLLALWSVLAAAAPADEKKLKDVQRRIQSLSRDVSKDEQSRDALTEQLRASDLAISRSNRELLKLGADREAVEQQLRALETQTRQLDRQTAAQQTQLARLLNRQFAGGDADALALLFAGRDPNQAARDRYFLAQLARAKADLIGDLRAAAERKQQLAATARTEQEKLAAIERRQKAGRTELLAQKKQRAATLTQLAGRIRDRKQELAGLRRDEQRLSNLIEQLAAVAARKKAAPGKPDRKVGAGGTARPRAPAGKSYDPGRVGGAFGALRGKLNLPVAGQIANRFGSARADGGTTWKGLFIRAAEGAPVRAVAAGVVVFADWLRGFGNLLIVDHGDDFLSVYGNNDALLVADGAKVGAGQAIASAGNSGGNADSGLYFELRHQGQAFDPMKWIGNR